MFRHFEAAEMEFMRSIDCAYSAPHMQSVSFPRVHVECDFSAEIRFDDLAEILLTIERVGNSSFTLAFQTLVNALPAAKGRITVVCVDRDTKKACPIPPSMADQLKRHVV